MNMAATLHSSLLAVAIVTLSSPNFQGSQSTVALTIIPDLRQYNVKGHFGRFMTPSAPLEEELYRRMRQDVVCGNDVSLELAYPQESFYEPGKAAINIIYSTIDDITLDRELSCEMKERVAVSYSNLAIQLPYTSGSGPGVITLTMFTDSTKLVSNPYTTGGSTVQLDRIEHRHDGTVIFHRGDDIMELHIYEDSMNCSKREESDLRKDIDEVVGKTFHETEYPLPFDYWGCDSLGWDVSFCHTLKGHRCGLQRVANDVCTGANMTKRHYCPASMTLVNATGYFRDELFFVPSFPLVSFEAEVHEKHHSTGIVYPCLGL